MREWHNQSHGRWYCRYHIVIVPKYRQKAIFGTLRKDMGKILRELCDQMGIALVEGHAMPDHVHLLVECDPQFGIHRLVRLLKGRSSRLLRQEFPVLKRKLPTLWTNSYFVSTSGRAPLSVMKHYIENQKYV